VTPVVLNKHGRCQFHEPAAIYLLALLKMSNSGNFVPALD